MLSNHAHLVLAAVVAASGCGGGGGDSATSIDCAWFAADNCWKQAAAAATACTDGALIGTFNAETTVCTYADAASTTVTFASSASATYSGSGNWDFTITNDSGTCVDWLETDSSLTVTTSLGTFSESYGGSSVVITCMDGKSYSIGQLTMLGCDWSTLPGTVTSGSATIQFSLLAAPAGDATLWRCGP